MCFCRNSNFGRTVGFTERPRELHAASSVVAELTPFSFSLFFSFSLVRSSPAGSPRGGRRRQVGEEGEPLRRTVSDRGPRMGPKPWLGGVP
jgi:hypothetical protein